MEEARKLPPRAVITWADDAASHRIIVRRYEESARAQAFARLSGLAVSDIEALLDLRARLDPLSRAEHGTLRLVRPGDAVTGPGAGLIMSSFVTPGRGGRFSRPELDAAYYASASEATAITETVHHQTRALRASARGPVRIPMMLIRADLVGKLHDVRAWRESHSALYDRDDYAASQALGARLRAVASDGVVYQSVRHAGGTCAAVFRPRVLSDARLAASLTYEWDGASISVVGREELPR